MKLCKVLLIVALLICLMPMPYGYYILVRFASTIIFGLMAYNYYEKSNKSMGIICGVLSLLFQPLVKVPLGREMWNIVDVLAALLLFYLIIKERQTKS